MLARATGAGHFLAVGERLLAGLERTRTACGMATIADVRNGRLEDRLDSFVLAETLK